MLTFRKTLIIAAFVFTIVYLFQSSGSTPKSVPADTPVGTKTTEAVSSYPPSTAKATGSAAQPTRPYPPPKGPLKDKQAAQQPVGNLEGKPLKDRLRYQYPYDPDGKFPGYIWQTWKTTPSAGDFGDELRAQEASWTVLHPGFVHEVITDDTAVLLIQYLYASIPEVQEAYKALPIPVLKADFFRYLILLARGGIYSDIDTLALKSATEWIPDEVPSSAIGLVIGIEADPKRDDWKEWYSRRIQFCQWTIQAKVGHPVLRDVVATITEDTLRMKRAGLLKKGKLDKSIVEFTGPAVWTDAVFNYFNSPEYFKIGKDAKNITYENFTDMTTPKRVGDVVVLPITSFSPGVQQMGAKETDDPMAFVKHEFEGSWKAAWEHVKPVFD